MQGAQLKSLHHRHAQRMSGLLLIDERAEEERFYTERPLSHFKRSRVGKRSQLLILSGPIKCDTVIDFTMPVENYKEISKR